MSIRKKYLLAFLAFLWSLASTCLAENPNTTSQNHSAGDTNTVMELIVKSKVFIDNDPDQSMEYASQAFKLSEKLNYPKGQAEALRRIGIFYMFRSDYTKALDNVLKALRISEQINDKALVSRCLMNMGGIYYDFSEYNLALSYFSKSLKIAKENNDKQIISGCLTNTANVYTDLGNYKLALDNYQNALKINVELQDKQGISITLGNIGNVYFYQENYKAAEDYYIKCLKIKKELDDKPGIIVSLNSIGKLFLKTAKYDKAIEYCTQSFDLAREINSMDDIYRASHALSSAYKKKGDFKTALAYYELGSSVKDSIFNETKNKELGKLESKYEIEKQDHQINLLKKDRALKESETHRQISNRNMIIGGILLGTVIIISFIQYQYNRRTKKTNQQLLRQNKEIEAKSEALEIANEELDNFIYRSSHDLKAPLTSVLGLINITRLELKEDSLREYLLKMQESVDKLMVVLQDLSNYSRNSRLAVATEEIDFKSIVETAVEGLKHLDKFKSVNIIQNITGTGTFYSDNLRVSILISNLISNAITHHELSRSEPIVTINLNYNAEKAIIEVVDNGSGIEDEVQGKMFEMFYKGSNESQGAGLGLYIVQGVIKKLNGKITFKTVELEGSTFTAEIPNTKPV